MSAPALAVQIQGQGAVSADNLNTYAQTTDTALDLRNFIGVPGVEVLVRGTSAVNDTGGGSFYWNPTGTGPDDGVNTIVPFGVSVGCWVRVNETSGLNNATLTGTATIAGTMVLPGGGRISSAGRLGIGMVPVNVVDIDTTPFVGNAAGIEQIKNTDPGSAATAEYKLVNNASISTLKILGNGYTPNGIFRADGTMLLSAGAGGLTLGTSVNQPVFVAVNNSQVAQFTSTGATFGGETKFGDNGAFGTASAAHGNPVNGGTLDLACGTAGLWSGFLIAQNGNNANLNIRTSTVYAVIARGSTAAFTSLATADGSGGAFTFTITCPAAGVIRLTNTAGSQSIADLIFFGSFGS